MWPFKSKEERARIARKKRRTMMDDIVGVCRCDANGYSRYCAKCACGFGYWYNDIRSKCCPNCAHVNIRQGELMVATKSGRCPDYNITIAWLRAYKEANPPRHRL